MSTLPTRLKKRFAIGIYVLELMAKAARIQRRVMFVDETPKLRANRDLERVRDRRFGTFDKGVER
jgi:hypothetical protein